MYIIDIFFNFIMLTTIWGKGNLIIDIIALIISITQLLFYFLAGTVNPGLPRYDYQYKANKPGFKGYFRKCEQCNLWIALDKRCYHCERCGVCIEGYDHHCPWTTKCIGERNIKFFYGFLGFTMLALFYYIFVGLMIGLQERNKRNK